MPGSPAPRKLCRLLAEILGDRDIAFPDDPPEDVSLEELTRRGTDLMHTLHGDRARLGYAAPDNPVTGALYPTAIQYGYGEIWFRPGLERRQRALVAVAGFTALRLPEQVGQIWPIGPECRPVENGGHRGGHPNRPVYRFPAGAERARCAERRRSAERSSPRLPTSWPGR